MSLERDEMLDDGAAARRLDHLRHHAGGEQEGLGDVEAQRVLEERLGGLERGSRAGAARVVHQQVDLPVLVEGGLDQPIEVFGLRDVGGHRQRPPTAFADRGSRVVEIALGARGTDDVGTGFGEGEGDPAPDALASAGDDRHLVGELEAIEDHDALRAYFGAARPATSGRSR